MLSYDKVSTQNIRKYSEKMNVQLVVDSTITKNNFSKGIIWRSNQFNITHTHLSNDIPQQCYHCFRPAIKPLLSTNNENIQRFAKYRIMLCHVLWQKHCVTDINMFISIRPEVRHVNRKSTTLLSTTFNKTKVTVGTDSLSHTVRNLVILAYFDPTPKWKGGQ